MSNRQVPLSNTMAWNRRLRAPYGLIAVALITLTVGGVVVALRLLSNAKVGDVDPYGAIVGTVTLVLGIPGLVFGALSWWLARAQPANLTDAAFNLAVKVKRAESNVRRHLLGRSNATIDVVIAWHHAPTAAMSTQEPVTQGQGNSLKHLVDQFHLQGVRRLAITGAPGAGKTLLAIDFILGLLEIRAPDGPVPIRLSASSWDVTQSVEKLLEAYLVQTYEVPKFLASQLVAARLILPVVDGLDEMDTDPKPGYASRAGQALRALDAYRDGRHHAAIVVTCRAEQYRALRKARAGGEKIDRVEVLPVTPSQAIEFLQQSVDDPMRWEQVLKIIRHRSGSLAKALSNPWRLSLAVIVYESRNDDGVYLHDPSVLAKFTSVEAISDHLLSSLIPASVTDEAPYTPGQVHAYLAVLARHMYADTKASPNAGRQAPTISDFILHELWTLTGPKRAQAWHIMCIFITGLIVYTSILVIDVKYSQIAAMLSITGSLFSYFPRQIRPRFLQLNHAILASRTGRRILVSRIARGLLLGATIGGMVLIILRSDRLAVLVSGFGGGAIVGAIYSIGVDSIESETFRVQSPRDFLRADVVFGVMVGVSGGLVFGVGSSFIFDPLSGLIYGIAAGFLLFINLSYASMRYAVFLMQTRRWSRHPLPLRLGRFLDWCYEIGLIRISGTAYQFRHQELQNYLARNPVP